MRKTTKAPATPEAKSATTAAIETTAAIPSSPGNLNGTDPSGEKGGTNRYLLADDAGTTDVIPARGGETGKEKTALLISLVPHLSWEQIKTFEKKAAGLGMTPERALEALIRGNLNGDAPGIIRNSPNDASAAVRPSPAQTMARCVRETGFTAREIRKLAVEGFLRQYAERGEFTLPLTFAPSRRERETKAEPDTVRTLIHREKLALLERHAATLGCDPGKLAAVLVELEADRREAEENRPGPKPAFHPAFGIKARHRRKFTRFANLLGVDPKRFLRWQMSHVVRELEKHLLTEWAAEMIVYESPEEREAAIARVEAWMSRRNARMMSKPAAA